MSMVSPRAESRWVRWNLSPLERSNPDVNLPDGLLALLHQPSLCYLATLMPDGSPQLTQTWVDTDGEHILINSVAGFQKIRNIERDPRVALTVSDPENPARYVTRTARPTISRNWPSVTWAARTRGTAAAAKDDC
jgi:PPOX class probable F420-dependent enzyme